MSVLKRLRAAKGTDDLAALLGFKPSAVTYILYKLPDSAKYTTFKIPKKAGGEREICAPTDQLKLLQKRLANLLYKCRAEIDRESGLKSLSHGFRKNHSIVTNAKPHQGRRFVLNLDLKDFFPSINFGRVRGFFIKSKAFELNEKVATLVAQIACHQNMLPQGSPCSPVISDLLAHLLDARLAKMAKREGVTYSHYADDLTFSTNRKVFPAAFAIQSETDAEIWELGKELASRIVDAGFVVNSDKTRMQCRTSRQLVTSLTVNAKVNVRVEYYKRTRAMCDSLFKTGNYSDRPFNKSLARRRDIALALPDDEDIKDGMMSTKTGITSLDLLGGRMAHIHHVKDKIDIREELEKRKHRTAFRKLYYRFLFYRNFVALDRPLILTEGKTDNVYLSLSARYSSNFQPKLGYFKNKKFHNSLRYFNHLSKTRHVMELDGGSGNFKFFVIRYKELMESFAHKTLAHPVILLLDNDSGAKDIFAVTKKNYGIEINYDDKHQFYHVTHNLYIVKTPLVGSKKMTCIEDMFEPDLLKEKLGGKTLNLGTPNPATEYGKHIFAEKVVRPKAPSLNWTGFEPLLQRVAEVLDHYKAPA